MALSLLNMCMLSWLIVPLMTRCAHANDTTCDGEASIVIWGGTVCGITATMAAASQNKTVLWVVNGTRLGGMTSGGLGGRDGGKNILGGFAAELWEPLGQNFEPHTAEERILQLLHQANTSSSGTISLKTNSGWLQTVTTTPTTTPTTPTPTTPTPTTTTPKRIVSMTTMSGFRACGAVFIDCSYEGDLLRLSHTAYAVGREATTEYNETMAGQGAPPFQNSDSLQSYFNVDVSPFVDTTNTTLLPTIVERYKGVAGAADDWVMAMCFRMCLTNNATNAIPITQPQGYDVSVMELLRREIISVTHQNVTLSLASMFLVRQLPNMKIDLNSGQWTAGIGHGGYFPFSTDLPFAQHDWAVGDALARARVFTAHKFWTQAMLYYLANDAEITRLQPALVKEMASYGLCGDEYLDSHNWSPQLYVREAIRLQGAHVITQADICDETAAPRSTSVGLSQWQVDIHAVKRVAWFVNNTWRVVNAGGRDTGRSHANPPCGIILEVPYEALTPKIDDTANLLVPVCASFTHVAFATYRLEPQYAIFGHSAGIAASLALNQQPSLPVVQTINISDLRRVLKSQGQLVSRATPPPPSPITWGCTSTTTTPQCVGLAHGGDYPNATCDHKCEQLSNTTWLAQTCCNIWSSNTDGSQLTALTSTWLKKSTALASTLPSSDKLAVNKGDKCDVVDKVKIGGTYVLCSPQHRQL